MDNLGLDTTDVPLRMYSKSDLLIFQNRFDEAFAKLDAEARYVESQFTKKRDCICESRFQLLLQV